MAGRSGDARLGTQIQKTPQVIAGPVIPAACSSSQIQNARNMRKTFISRVKFGTLRVAPESRDSNNGSVFECGGNAGDDRT